MKAVFNLWIVLIFLLVSKGIFATENYDHVHIILDTSMSMRDYNSTDSKGNSISIPGQDPSKLSLLSVKLLADLLYPVFIKSSDGDSLTVSTFKLNYEKLAAVGSGFPSGVGKTIILGRQQAAWNDFKNKIDTINRDATKTYFYPGIKYAVDAIKRIPRKSKESRTIILITDGDSDSKKTKYGGSPAKYAEEKTKLSKLAEKMDTHNIKLYILAFGDANDISFLEGMVTASSDKIGKVFHIQNAESLMAGMANIFSERFGYSIEPEFNTNNVNPYLSIFNTTTLDLKGNDYNKIVGVLSIHSNPSIPEFNLLESTGADPVNEYSDDQANNATEEISKGDNNSSLGGGYKLKWLDQPSGKYDFNPINPNSQKIIILRPLNVDVGIGGVKNPDASYMTQAGINRKISVIADYPEDIFFFAKTKTTGKTPPSSLVVEYGKRGKWNNQDSNYSQLSIEPFISASSYTPPPNPPLSGRWYKANNIEYPQNPNASNREDTYEASLPVVAKLNDRFVGSSEELRAKKVLVYPYMNISPNPSTIQLKNQNGEPILAEGEKGCATFEFSFSGNYYKEFKNNITIKANLVDTQNIGAIGQLNRASFSLEDKKIAIDNPNKNTGLWLTTYSNNNNSRTTLEQLQSGSTKDNNDIYKYQLCVVIGIPTEGGANKPVNLELKLSIDEEPYRRVEIIHPLKVEIKVQKPNWTWWNLLWLLPLLLLLWLVRFVPDLENDLRYTYYKDGDNNHKSLYKFTISKTKKIIRRLINHSGIYDINSISTQASIGKIIPIEDGLYAVKFSKPIKLSHVNNEIKNYKGDWQLIHVNVSYNLLLNNDSYTFRVEYE